jgi:hypothetical protein
MRNRKHLVQMVEGLCLDSPVTALPLLGGPPFQMSLPQSAIVPAASRLRVFVVDMPLGQSVPTLGLSTRGGGDAARLHGWRPACSAIDCHMDVAAMIAD